MKTVKFNEKLVNLILTGKKTSTWRLFDDKDLSVGDMLEFVNQQTGEKFAQARIVQVEEKRLGDVTEKDFDGHERYVNPAEMFQTFREYYGDRVDEETLVKMIDFQLKKNRVAQ